MNRLLLWFTKQAYTTYSLTHKQNKHNMNRFFPLFFFRSNIFFIIRIACYLNESTLNRLHQHSIWFSIAILAKGKTRIQLFANILNMTNKWDNKYKNQNSSEYLIRNAHWWFILAKYFNEYLLSTSLPKIYPWNNTTLYFN